MDTVADFLIRIKNAALAGHHTVVVPYSKMKENLAKILVRESFLGKVEVVLREAKKDLLLTLGEEKGKPRLIEVKRISKPGRRVFVKAKEIRNLTRGLGTMIISSPAGLVTNKEALKKNLGGEAICKII